MYAVVGCGECKALWIVEGRPARSECPRCGTTRKFEKRRQFVTTEDENHAREVRASMLAARQGQSDAFAELESFAELGDRVEDAGIDDETYLAQSGLDPDAVATAGQDESASKSREKIVREAIETLDDPTEKRVLEYCARQDLSASYVQRALEKLVRSGEASENRGVYRLL